MTGIAERLGMDSRDMDSSTLPKSWLGIQEDKLQTQAPVKGWLQLTSGCILWLTWTETQP